VALNNKCRLNNSLISVLLENDQLLFGSRSTYFVCVFHFIRVCKILLLAVPSGELGQKNCYLSYAEYAGEEMSVGHQRVY